MLGSAVATTAEAAGHSVQRCGRKEWDVALEAGPKSVEGTPDCVIHCAAVLGGHSMSIGGSDTLANVNVLGAWRVADWCARQGISHLVLISSAIVYGRWDEAPKREIDPVYPWAAGAYAATKWLSEQAVAGVRAAGISLSVLRLSSLYGAGYARGLAQKLLAEGRKHGRIAIERPENDAFHLLHVDDAARTVVQAAERRADGLWNIGGPALVTFAELAQVCAETTNASLHIKDGTARERRILNWIDDTRARSDLGHSPRVGLAEGIGRIENLERKEVGIS